MRDQRFRDSLLTRSLGAKRLGRSKRSSIRNFCNIANTSLSLGRSLGTNFSLIVVEAPSGCMNLVEVPVTNSFERSDANIRQLGLAGRAGCRATPQLIVADGAEDVAFWTLSNGACVLEASKNQQGIELSLHSSRASRSVYE